MNLYFSSTNAYTSRQTLRNMRAQVPEELQIFGKKPEYTDKHMHPAVKQVRCFSGQLCPELDFHKVLDLGDWKPIALGEDVGTLRSCM